ADDPDRPARPAAGRAAPALAVAAGAGGAGPGPHHGQQARAVQRTRVARLLGTDPGPERHRPRLGRGGGERRAYPHPQRLRPPQRQSALRGRGPRGRAAGRRGGQGAAGPVARRRPGLDEVSMRLPLPGLSWVKSLPPGPALAVAVSVVLGTIYAEL